MREAYAEALASAERAFRDAQESLQVDSSDDARKCYAKALAEYDKLQAQFPFVSAGVGDDEV